MIVDIKSRIIITTYAVNDILNLKAMSLTNNKSIMNETNLMVKGKISFKRP